MTDRVRVLLPVVPQVPASKKRRPQEQIYRPVHELHCVQSETRQSTRGAPTQGSSRSEGGLGSGMGAGGGGC